jgi:hypothetical protein
VERLEFTQDNSNIDIRESILDLLRYIEYRPGSIGNTSFYNNVYFVNSSSQFYYELQILNGTQYLVGNQPFNGDSRPLFPTSLAQVGAISVFAPERIGQSSIIIPVEVTSNIKLLLTKPHLV